MSMGDCFGCFRPRDGKVGGGGGAQEILSPGVYWKQIFKLMLEVGGTRY